MPTTDIATYFVPGQRAHLVGIGGVSMAPLAEVLHGMGLTITGSDSRQSATVEHLQSLGITVHIGHSAENLEAEPGCRRTGQCSRSGRLLRDKLHRR